MACPPGKVLNPRTLHCVKATGRTAQKLVAQGNIAEVYAPPMHRTTIRQRPLAAAFGAGPGPALRVRVPVPCGPGQERNPATGRCRKTQRNVRRTSSNGPATLPLGAAEVAPLSTREAILGWTHLNCKNDRDPITGIDFASADTATLQDVIRLHDRTCVLASQLHEKVATNHKAGQIVMVPDGSRPLTLDDFKALREAMRRRNPAYKIPARKHQPPPPNWQLYISSDNRSGPDYASVLIVDSTKIHMGPAGPEFPEESVLMDLGFIPLTITDGLCKPQMFVDLIRRLSEANRLLIPVAGGWKPIGGLPYSKRYWQTKDAKERLNKLCLDLTRALTTPM